MKKAIVIIALIVITAAAAGVFFLSGRQKQADYGKLIGDWGRTDGDYVIRISSTNPDGTLQAAYFNPNPINIAQAAVSLKKDAVEVFLELRDVGYPGSKYNLVYDAGQDSLEGTYFQAQAQQVYDVEFQRITLTTLKKGY